MELLPQILGQQLIALLLSLCEQLVPLLLLLGQQIISLALLLGKIQQKLLQHAYTWIVTTWGTVEA